VNWNMNRRVFMPSGEMWRTRREQACAGIPFRCPGDACGTRPAS
jgi:hypothetical protein